MSGPIGTIDLDPDLVTKFRQLQFTPRAWKQVLILQSIEELCQFAHKPLRFPDRELNIGDEEYDYTEPTSPNPESTPQQSAVPSSPVPPPIIPSSNTPISFGEQQFLNELFTLLDQTLNQSTLKRVSLFWAKFTFHYPEYFMVFLSNHILLASFFDTLRRLLQKPNMLFVLENMCEPFLYFKGTGALTLQHFLDNSPVFNPLISPRTKDPEATPPMSPQATPPTTPATLSKLNRSGNFSTMSRLSLWSRGDTAKNLNISTSNNSVPPVVSPRASMSALFTTGNILPGQKLDIFSLIGYPAISDEDILTFPQRLTLLSRSFPTHLNADAVSRVLDEISTFFMNFDILTPRLPPTPPVDPKNPRKEVIVDALPVTKWYSRATGPERMGNVKEIAICKYQPPDVFQNDLKQHAIEAYAIALEVIQRFIDHEVEIAASSPQQAGKKTQSSLPTSVANFIDSLLLATFSQISLQLYFHPRARFLPRKYYQQVVLKYANLPQLLQLFQKGFFSSYYPGPEYGISIVCKDVHVVLTRNVALSTIEKENFILAIFQLCPVIQVMYLYLMYGCTVEHVSEDVRLKYISAKDFYWFTAMMLAIFDLSTSISANPSQSFKFMQYFASIGMFRFSKWSDVLIKGECEALTRAFLNKKTVSATSAPSIKLELEKYALQPPSIPKLLTYLYDWLYAHSSLGTYIAYKNTSVAQHPVEIKLPETFYLFNDYKQTMPDSGQFIEFDDSLQDIVKDVEDRVAMYEKRREEERVANEAKNLSKKQHELTQQKQPLQESQASLPQDQQPAPESTPSTPETTTPPAVAQPQPSSSNSNHNNDDDGVDEYQKSLSFLLTRRRKLRANYIKLLAIQHFPRKSLPTSQTIAEEEDEAELTPEQRLAAQYEHPLAPLQPKQRDPIEQWATKMLRNSTLSPPAELSQLHLGFYLYSDKIYTKLTQHVDPVVGNQLVSRTNPFAITVAPTTSTPSSPQTQDSQDVDPQEPEKPQLLMKPAQFPILSDTTLSEYSENLIKVYIAGLLLGSEELTPKPQIIE